MSNLFTPFEKYPVVNIINKQAKTTSLNVAEVFDKRHDNVIRDINDLIEKVPEEFAAENFEANKIKVLNNPSGEEISHYSLTRDGFILLVMGFTGDRVIQFKIAFLEAFNQMEERLRHKELTALPDPESMAKARRDGYAAGVMLSLDIRLLIQQLDLDDDLLQQIVWYRLIGLTQREAASLSGISKDNIGHIERVLDRHGVEFAYIPGNKRKNIIRQRYEDALKAAGMFCPRIGGAL